MNHNTCAYLIVTCNGEATLSALLDSIPSPSDILVIDNDSRDQTKDILKQKGIRCIENNKNRGYGAAINQGLSLLQETHEFVVVLNQDVVLQQFKPDISILSSYAIVQPLILLPTGQINVTTLAMNVFGYVYPPDFAKLPNNQKKSEPFFFSGAAFIINIKKWKEVGPFDESLFLYYEDIDYAIRLFLAGEKIVFDPSLIVIHAYHNSFLHQEKKTLLSMNRKIILHRYLPPLWRKLVFIPNQHVKDAVPDQQKREIASRLLPIVLLGFYTKQIPGWKRLCINIFLIPYSFCIRWILRRSAPRL